MPGLIAFITGICNLIATGVGAFSSAGLIYAGLIWKSGDHERAKRHLWGVGWGAGLTLTAVALGTAVAAIPHA